MTTNYKPTPNKFRKAGEKTHGEGRHHAHRVGDRISYKAPSGRCSGVVKEVHKEFYVVSHKGKLVKVNRNSILYAMGTFLGSARQHLENTRKAYEFGKQKENERLDKFKRSYGESAKKPVRKRKVKHS